MVCSNPSPRLGDLRVDFRRVPKQVVEDYPHKPVVRLSRKVLRDAQVHTPVRIFLLQLLKRRARDGGKINRFTPQVGAANARERQKVVDELAHAPRRFTYTAQVVLALRSEFVGVVLKQQLAASVDAAKQGTQVVRNRAAD